MSLRLAQLALLTASVVLDSNEVVCELPTNFQSLPEFAQDEIRAVWKNYEPGQDCRRELLITEDIIAVLDMFDKELGQTDRDFLATGGKIGLFTPNPGNKVSTDRPPDTTTREPLTTSHARSTTDEPITAEFPTTTQTTTTTTIEQVLFTTTATSEKPVVSPIKPADPLDPIQPVNDHQWEFRPNSEVEFPTLTSFVPQPTKIIRDPVVAAAQRTTSEFRTPQHTTSATTIIRPTIAFSEESFGDEVHRNEPLNQSGSLDDEDVESPKRGEDSSTRDEQSLKSEEEHPEVHTTARPIRPRKFKVNFKEYQDYDQLVREEEKKQRDVQRNPDYEAVDDKFLEPIEDNLPFLTGANRRVQNLFKEVLSDPEVLSEGRRHEEIHVLAVSYLSPEQLKLFNKWSKDRRKRIVAREANLFPLSFRARQVLKDLSLTPAEGERQAKLGHANSSIKDELRTYALLLREERKPSA